MLPIRTIKSSISRTHSTRIVADVKQIRAELTNDKTGTTFMLTADGLYVIRRPAVEEEYNIIHEWQVSHPG
jgi:exopolysaccharide biosynthesis protein